MFTQRSEQAEQIEQLKLYIATLKEKMTVDSSADKYDGKMLEKSKDLLDDLRYSFEHGEEQNINKEDLRIIAWLIEQAKRSEMYKYGLLDISTSSFPHHPRGYATHVLHEADLRFNKNPIF